MGAIEFVYCSLNKTPCAIQGHRLRDRYLPLKVWQCYVAVFQRYNHCGSSIVYTKCLQDIVYMNFDGVLLDL